MKLTRRQFGIGTAALAAVATLPAVAVATALEPWEGILVESFPMSDVTVFLNGQFIQRDIARVMTGRRGWVERFVRGEDGWFETTVVASGEDRGVVWQDHKILSERLEGEVDILWTPRHKPWSGLTHARFPERPSWLIERPMVPA